MAAIVSAKQKDQDVDNDGKSAAGKGAAGGQRSAKPPKGVDRWFDTELNKLYVDVVNEPLPEDLARLITQLKARKAT